VREQLLRIPVVFVSFGHSPLLRAQAFTFASQIEIAPTLLGELGLPPPRTWVGQPLQGHPAARFTYFEEHDDAGLIDRRDAGNTWKYWINTRSGVRRAFNLSSDPEEDRDVSSELPAARVGEWRLRALLGTPVDAPHAAAVTQ